MKYVYALFAAVLAAGLYYRASWQAYAGFVTLVYVVALAHVIGYHVRRRRDHRHLIEEIMHVLNEDKRAGGMGRMTLAELAMKIREHRYEQRGLDDNPLDPRGYMPKLRHVKQAFDVLATQDDAGVAEFGHYLPKGATYGFLPA